MDQPKLITLPTISASGANLTAVEADSLPFEIKRVFWLTELNHEVVRGEHSHKSSKQILVALRGKIEITLEDTEGVKSEFILQDPHTGLYIPPLFWGRILFSRDSIGLALADDLYKESDYIRDYDEFKNRVK